MCSADRPGIVAGVSGALLRHGANIEDSRMAILGGHFTMMLIVSTPDETDVGSLNRELDETRSRLGLGALTLWLAWFVDRHRISLT